MFKGGFNIKNCGIYYIKNNISQQIYIGQTVDIQRRQKQHFQALKNNKHVNNYLQNSFNKYGENAFEFGVIEHCNPDKLDELEKAYMNMYNVRKNGFNICEGGTHICLDNSNENHGMFRHDIPNDKLKELYLKGYNSTQLSHIYNCSYRTIQRRLKKIFGEKKYNELKKEKHLKGVKNADLKDPNISNESILKLANKGLNSVEIAEKIGCSDSAVMNRLQTLYTEKEYEEYKKTNLVNKMKYLRSKVTEEGKHKIIEAHKKYTLWDGSKTHYYKGTGLFYLRYNAKDMRIGSFNEFISIYIIHNLIKEFSK